MTREDVVLNRADGREPTGSKAGRRSPGAGAADREYQLRILASLRRIVRAIDIHSRRLRAEHDLTAPQLICLIVTVEQGPLTATRIAQEVHLSKSTVVGILDRLEKKGLVRRKRDSEDRRLVNVTATRRGSELAEIAPTPLQSGLADGLRNLPEPMQASIAQSLERIVEMMEARHIAGVPILGTDAVTQDEAEQDSATSAGEGESHGAQ
jgi:DNA-binding MarR family transcriptional regulator